MMTMFARVLGIGCIIIMTSCATIPPLRPAVTNLASATRLCQDLRELYTILLGWQDMYGQLTVGQYQGSASNFSQLWNHAQLDAQGVVTSTMGIASAKLVSGITPVNDLQAAIDQEPQSELMTQAFPNLQQSISAMMNVLSQNFSSLVCQEFVSPLPLWQAPLGPSRPPAGMARMST